MLVIYLFWLGYFRSFVHLFDVRCKVANSRAPSSCRTNSNITILVVSEPYSDNTNDAGHIWRRISHFFCSSIHWQFAQFSGNRRFSRFFWSLSCQKISILFMVIYLASRKKTQENEKNKFVGKCLNIQSDYLENWILLRRLLFVMWTKFPYSRFNLAKPSNYRSQQ